MLKKSLKAAVILLAVCLITTGISASAEYEPLPDVLRVHQHTIVDGNNTAKRRIMRTYPDTVSAAVNTRVSRIVDRLADRIEPLLPAKVLRNGMADTGATVRVTGTSTVSFLIVAHAAADLEQICVEFETAVFNIRSGRQLKLDDLFDEGADAVISEAVRAQLTAYFPDEEPDGSALDLICGAVRTAPFTLSPAYLQLHYYASDLYPGKKTLMHVKIPYRQLTGYMTDYARAELDNNRYRLAALTFDDGPGRGVTANLMVKLREFGAVGTFFNLGSPMRNAHDYVAWEHDSGQAVQSHTYTHTIGLDNQEKMYKERDRFARDQIAIIGIPPSYMRAPGGLDKLYCRYEIGMPVIRWNTLSGDAVADRPVDPDACIATMMHTLKDSSVILMHNIRETSVSVAGLAMDRLEKRGYMYVTVDELFEIRGIPLKNNTVYYGDEADQQE